jgi:tetratricopeptide (TPR) repeat protein
VELLVKYCPSCGKAGVEGVKFCPQCGQKLTGFDLEEKRRSVNQPEAPVKERNWFGRHLNWTLLLGVIGGPFLLFWIVFGIVNLVALFSVNIAAWIFRIAVPSEPIAFIVIIVLVVRWYREQRRQSRAMAGYDRAIKLDPSNAATYNERGYAYDEIGEYNQAIADYNKAIELNPSDADAYYNRGLAYQEKGEMPKAISDLDKCIGLSTGPELTKAAQQALHKAKKSL